MLDAVYKRLRDFYPQQIPLVFGEGRKNAEIMLIGEAPGKDEVANGRPFCGKAGKNLDEFLSVVGIAREDIFISNVCKFRPAKTGASGRLSNRTPTKAEVAAALPFLYDEIAAVAPRCIVTLGNTPLRAVTGDFKAIIGALHGRAAECAAGGACFSLFPLYHPASIIYNRALSQTYMDDLELLRKFIAKNNDY